MNLLLDKCGGLIVLWELPANERMHLDRDIIGVDGLVEARLVPGIRMRY